MASPRGQRGLEALWRVRGDAKSLPRPRAQRSSTCVMAAVVAAPRLLVESYTSRHVTSRRARRHHPHQPVRGSQCGSWDRE